MNNRGGPPTRLADLLPSIGTTFRLTTRREKQAPSMNTSAPQRQSQPRRGENVATDRLPFTYADMERENVAILEEALRAATCKVCGDIRWLRNPAGGPMQPCPACSNPDPEALMRLAGIPLMLAGATIQGFQVGGPTREDRESQQASKDAAQEFALGKARHQWLVLKGSPGVGKSHLAAGILADRALHPAHGPAGRFVNVPETLERMRRGFEDGSYIAAGEEMTTPALVVLDDIGVRVTPWTDEQLYLVLNHRWNNKMQTIVTTNAELRQMEPRVADRLQASRSGFAKLVTIRGQSFR